MKDLISTGQLDRDGLSESTEDGVKKIWSGRIYEPSSTTGLSHTLSCTDRGRITASSCTPPQLTNRVLLAERAENATKLTR
jgi:hypothetical protein